MSETTFTEGLRTRWGQLIPHVGALGIELLEIDARATTARLPIRPEFIGDLERQWVHTGVITTLVDSVGGAAIFAHIGKSVSLATLDLRMDYLYPAVAALPLYCRVECHRLAKQIAFLRATVWQADESKPVATAVATFMRGASRATARRP